MGFWLPLEATKADSEVGLSPLLFRGVMTSWIVAEDLVPTKSSAVFKIFFAADTASGEITKFSNNSWYFSQASIFLPLGGVHDQVVE